MDDLRDELRTFYDEEGQKDYQAARYKPENWVYNRLKEVVLDYARALCRPAHTILDAGCAEGLYVRELSPYVAQVMGVDLSAPKVRRAIQYTQYPSNMHFSIASVEELPFPDASFDTLLSAETLEHVPEPAAALREIRRVLKPGGAFVCSIPTEADEYGGQFKQGLSWREKSGHLHSFSRQGFQGLLNQAGLAVEDTRVVDVLGGQIRRAVMDSAAWNALKRLRQRSRPRASTPVEPCRGGSASSAGHISLAWWRRLDGVLSTIPLVNARGSYCVYVAVKR